MLPIPIGRRPLRLWQAVGLFAIVLIVFVGFLVITVDSGDPASRDCRDTVLGQVPVYPRATLVNEDRSASGPTAGREWREYHTIDSPDDVAAYYRELASCEASENGAEGPSILCDGKLDSRHQVSYQARMARADNTTSISLFIGWYCASAD